MTDVPLSGDPLLLANRNNLDQAASPYLLQHRDNPVHWQPWGPGALAAAKALNKPILLSVGYAACHWCHVMAHESFENPAIAAEMNRLFVNIKVDREERPDIDTLYMNALHLLGEQGGWPLTMFLTPEAEPFWGGTYFPPEARYGRAGFMDVLHRVADAYHTKKDAIAKNKTMLVQGLRQMARPQNQESVAIDRASLDQMAEQVLSHVDPVHGGLGAAPKFPQSGVFELLWRAYLRSGRPDYAAAVLTTAVRMAQGGIYDHLGGGFARYSVDAEWLAPHFEKMLYDNAQLIEHFALLEAETHEPVLRQRIEETVAWLEREMIAGGPGDKGGGFAATLDADSEGEEGKFYVWHQAEIDALLGDDAAFFAEHYDVTPEGNWEHKTILRRSLSPDLLDDAGEARLAVCRAKLLAARDKRIRPGWDDKVLADWNGLMIAALASLARQYKQPHWLALAERAYGFVTSTMMLGGDRLGHSWRQDQLIYPGLLDDYAAMARAALALFEAIGNPAYLEQTRKWAEVLQRDYADPVHGGFFLTAQQAETLVARSRIIADNATPSGNGLLVGVFARLWYLTGDVAWREAAESQIAAFSGEAGRNFFALASFLNGADLYAHAVQVTILGHRGEAATEALIDAAYSVSLPNRILMVADPDATLPESHPAHGKTQLGGQPTAYVCVGQTCGLPVTLPDELAAQLRGTRAV